MNQKFNCSYLEINGGYNAVIELDGEPIAHKYFPNRKDAAQWTNDFIDGYLYKEAKEERRKDSIKNKIKLLTNNMMCLEKKIKMDIMEYTDFVNIRMGISGLIGDM